jgi:hypothetical protein
MDPVTAVEAGGQLVDIANEIAKVIETHKREVSVESQELAVRVPESRGELSIALRIKSGFYGGRLTFNIPNVERLTVHSLPAFRSENQTTSRNGNELIFDASKLSKDVDTVLLDLEYGLDPHFVESLVQRKWQLDPHSEDDADSYWVVAQLKHLRTLQEVYSKLELRGVDLRVDVGVYQDIKTKVPHKAMRTLERGSEFIGTRDREKLVRLMIEQRRDSGYLTGELMQAVRQLTDLFLPSRFEKYVEVLAPFYYYGCHQGTDFISPMLALPRFMTVISRTDLSLDEPAREGKVIYYKKKIQDAIGKIFR